MTLLSNMTGNLPNAPNVSFPNEMTLLSNEKMESMEKTAVSFPNEMTLLSNRRRRNYSTWYVSFPNEMTLLSNVALDLGVVAVFRSLTKWHYSQTFRYLHFDKPSFVP